MKGHVDRTSVSQHLAERIAMVPLFFAVVLGASLIHFHAVFFPPQVTRIEFWALAIAYLTPSSAGSDGTRRRTASPIPASPSPGSGPG